MTPYITTSESVMRRKVFPLHHTSPIRSIRGNGITAGEACERQTPPAGRDAAHRVALEGLEGPVAAQATHVDAHVGAAGGEGGVVLPVHVQGRRCVSGAERTLALMRRHQSAAGRRRGKKVFCINSRFDTHPSGRGTAAWLPPCERPK